MAIKSSGNSLAFSEIEAEFGQNGGRSLGGYRLTQNVGSLSNLPLDSGIPTSGQIKFSDFYGKRLNVVVDCHSGSREDRKSAKGDKWNNNAVTVIGGFRSKKESGSKIIINVNKKFCSDKSNQINCALKTGSWDSTATVQVDVGSSGQVLGAGGDGGKGADGINNNGNGGGNGTSGLGIEHNNVVVNIASGGILRAGFGGGGGGGGHRQVDKRRDRRAGGGGGGGGAGCPAGNGGPGGSTGGGFGSGSGSPGEQVLKLEEVEEVPVEIMLEKQLVDQVVQVDRQPVMLHLVQIVLLLEVQEEVMGLPFDEFRVMLLL